jgi:type VII secretion protein EssB
VGAETTIDLEGVPCVLDTSGAQWSFTVPRSLAPVRASAELDLLAHPHEHLLPCVVTEDDDTVTLHLTPEPGTLRWSEVQRMPRVDRLRALMNAGGCATLADRGYAVLLHPDNLTVDRNLRPRLAYRGLAGLMPPQDADGRRLLRQLQALVLCTMDPRASFSELVDGGATLRRASPFERSVQAAGSFADLTEYLTQVYDETVAAEADSLVRVGRRTHAAFRHAAVWLGVLAVVASASAGYALLVRAPFDERMLEAGARFVAADHDGVIETLRPVAEDRLPLAQRYALAASYLRGVNLSGVQRATIENGLSLSSERDFLTYWIDVGRGDLDDALDRARGLDDVDLVLYALTLLQEQVREDPGLGGAERETRLEELQAQYDRYLDARSSALDEDATTTPGSEPELDLDGTEQ